MREEGVVGVRVSCSFFLVFIECLLVSHEGNSRVTKGGLGCVFPHRKRKSMTKHASLE